jgi:SSS family solute:Na+ symporter
MMVLFQGILKAAAGPAPNYDMQRVLATRSPKEAAKMNWFVNVVLIFPRFYVKRQGPSLFVVNATLRGREV